MSPDRTTRVQLVPSGNADPAAERIRRTVELALAMDEVHDFRKGQLVRWKAGMKNRVLPAYNEPAVVRDVLFVPIFEACETSRCAGSPLFREPLTLVLGLLDADGDFVELRYDARRFEPAAIEQSSC